MSNGVPRSLVVASEWAWRLIVVAIVVAAVVWGLVVVGFIVGPILVATFIAAMLEPVRRLLTRVGVPTRWAWLVAFLFGIVLVSSVTTLAVTEFSANFDELSEQAQGGLDEFANWLETGPLNVDAGGLENAVDRALDSIRDDPSAAVTGTFSVLTTTGALLAAALLTVFTTFFLMKDRSIMWLWFCRLFPDRVRHRVDSAGRSAWEVLIGYTKVTLTSAVVDSLAIGIAAAIAGLPVSFALAVVVFLFAFIPTLGAIISGLLVVLVALVSQGPTTALILFAVVLAVQQLDANVLYPTMASRHLAFHPLASVLLVAAGGVVGGIFGAFVAVPAVALVIAVGGDWRRTGITDTNGVTLLHGVELESRDGS